MGRMRSVGALEAAERAIGALIGVIRSRESVAGIEPVGEIGRIVGAGSLGHDVSILPGAGRHLGSQPRANVSMTIMRPPQHGHGDGRTRGGIRRRV